MFSTLQLQHFKDFYRRYLYLIGITCPARQKCLRHRHFLITSASRPPVSITLRAALRDLRLQRHAAIGRQRPRGTRRRSVQ